VCVCVCVCVCVFVCVCVCVWCIPEEPFTVRSSGSANDREHALIG